jgi:hypothetical protein
MSSVSLRVKVSTNSQIVDLAYGTAVEHLEHLAFL